MRGLKKTLHISMIITLALMLSACQSPMRGPKIPPPTLEYGWSGEQTMIVDNKEVPVKCMTIEDIDKINKWAAMMKASTEVGR